MGITRLVSKQPLPKNARKIFSGILFDVYQWDVKGYNGSTRTFEKLKRPDAAMVNNSQEIARERRLM